MPASPLAITRHHLNWLAASNLPRRLRQRTGGRRRVDPPGRLCLLSETVPRRGQTAVNAGSELLIFVARAALEFSSVLRSPDSGLRGNVRLEGDVVRVLEALRCRPHVVSTMSECAIEIGQMPAKPAPPARGDWTRPATPGRALQLANSIWIRQPTHSWFAPSLQAGLRNDPARVHGLG